MPFNGAGVFTRLYSWVSDKAAGLDITASRMDADANDIVSSGFGNTLTRDGQGQPTANLPMAGFRHTGAAAGVGTGDYVTVGQATNGTLAADFASLVVGGSSALTGGASIPNNVRITSKDSGGTARDVIGYMSDNYVHIYAGTAGFMLTNSAETTNIITVDNTGNVTTTGGTTSGLDAGGANFRLAAATYGSLLRNDNTNTYLLLTASGSPSGAFNTLRPLQVSNSTGAVIIDGTGAGVTLGKAGGNVTVPSTVALSGGGTSTTPAANDSSTKIATTAFANPGASLGGAGFQKLASGLNLQWGSAPASTVGNAATNTVAVTFTEAFPTGCVAVFVSFFTAEGGCSCSASTFTTTGCNVSYANLSSATQTLQAYYFAIGY